MKIEFNLIKRLVILLALALPFGFSGCSDSDDDNGDGGAAIPSSWTIPTGNANMPTGGTIVAQYSDAPEGSDISKLVDNNPDTKYQTNHSAFEITYNASKNVTIATYTLTSASDKPEMDPKSWTVYGSLDGKTWRVIDKQENQSFSDRKEARSYDIESPLAYRHYKLSVLTNNGGSATQIAEWKLTTAIFTGDINDLMKFSSGNTYSELTPMGKQHEGDRKATAADIAWLKNPLKEPDPFGGLAWTTFNITGSLYPYGTPSPADVNQRWIGDCSMEAVMAYMAHSFPGFIKSIIKETGKGTYAVTLYDPNGDKVEVGVSNNFVGSGTDLGASSGKGGRVTWSTVLEKAVIKWKQVYAGSSDIGGIGTEYVAAIFTGNGNSFSFNKGVLSPAELQRAVTVSIQQRKIVIGGFGENDLEIDGKYKSVTAHAYSFFLSPNDSYLFVMRNPWGSAPTIKDGVDGGVDDGLLYITTKDAKVPPSIDLRICDPGAAKAYALDGYVEPYNPPSFAPSPMLISNEVLRNPGNMRP